jgi:predicted small lipoprotein YifL
MKWFSSTILVGAMIAVAACGQRTPLGPDAAVREGTANAAAHLTDANAIAHSSVVPNGNGAPSGSHYTLNIIGVPKTKTASMTGDQGHRIFVPLTGNPKIMLAEGQDFEVLDANGTDGEATFQLPNPDPDGDGATVYSVFARALGTPGGKSLTTTCAIDPVDGSEVCSMITLTLERGRGKSTFENVSKYLLYIYADVDDDGILDRVGLFDRALQGYFWDYDNQGLKLAQLRFYDCSTTVPDATDPTGAQTSSCSKQ